MTEPIFTFHVTAADWQRARRWALDSVHRELTTLYTGSLRHTKENAIARSQPL